MFVSLERWTVCASLLYKVVTDCLITLFDLLENASFASEISFSICGLMMRWSFSWSPLIWISSCLGLIFLVLLKQHQRFSRADVFIFCLISLECWLHRLEMMILPVGLLFHGIWFIRRNRRWLFHNQREVLKRREGVFIPCHQVHHKR